MISYKDPRVQNKNCGQGNFIIYCGKTHEFEIDMLADLTLYI